MNKLLLLLFVFLLPLANVFSNDEIARQSDTPNIIAKRNINNLHNGILLVRLKTNSISINALKKMGNDERANRLTEQINKLNNTIINAFKTKFNFCPVYFFKSDESELVSNHNLDKVHFVTTGLLADTTFKVSDKEITVGEFALVGSENGNGFEALIIKDEQFVMLLKPFPAFVRTFEAIPTMRRTPGEVVEKMNANLNAFYKDQF
jgi:hypothetical protein